MIRKPINILALPSNLGSLKAQYSSRYLYLKISFAIYRQSYSSTDTLTQWGRLTHICVGKLTIIGSDNGLSPGRRQAIIWTSAGILFIGPLGTNFSEISIEILTFSFQENAFESVVCETEAILSRPQRTGLFLLRRLLMGINIAISQFIWNTSCFIRLV